MYTLSKIIVGVLAKLYLNKFKPTIIGVTGNAGKTSTKEAIGAVIGSFKKVRVGGGNLNNEVGLPFNVISDSAEEYYEKGGSLLFGIKTFFKSLFGLLAGGYPEVLVLEYGADQPGDIKRLTKIVKPNISVITTIGDVPVHVEHFKNAEAVAAEKANLIGVLETSDFAILNHDDPRVMDMRSITKARVMTYGFNNGSDVRATDLEYRSAESGAPIGVTFKLHHGDSFIPVHIDGSLGRSQAWSAAAAAAVGLAMGMNPVRSKTSETFVGHASEAGRTSNGMNLVNISQALTRYHGPKGRLKILEGVKGSNIIDDTYNASPASTSLALDVLKDLPAIRRIAVLGDMLELGDHTISAHRAVGQKAAGIADMLVCVGSRAKFIAESAIETHLLSEEQVMKFETSEEAARKLLDIIRRHDLILVKSSQGIRTEKIVKTLMADPSHASKLLVRQSKRWLSK